METSEGVSAREINPLISIVVPTYNVGSIIELCLRSIGAQTYDNIEVIVVDDGSTDSSLEVCRAFESDNIRVFSKPNAGPASARNFGLLHCSAESEYVFFVDSDDTVEPTYVSAMVEHATDDTLAVCGMKKQSGEAKAGCDRKLSGEATLYEDLWDNPDFLAQLRLGFINSSCNKCYSLQIIRRHGLTFRDAYPEDTFFNLSYLQYCSKIYHVHDELYNYIYHGESVTSKPYPSLYENYMQIQGILLDKVSEEYRSYIYELTYPQYLANTRKYIKAGDYATPARFLKDARIKEAIRAHKSTCKGDFALKTLYLLGWFRLLKLIH